MKKLITLIVMLVFVAGELSAARLYSSKGRVVDERGRAVEYATVVLLRDSAQVTGTATDAEGRFTLKVPAGDYTLRIQYLGYDPLTRQVHVAAESDLGDFVLRSSATQIEGVVVKARIVRRAADRFVVDVANAPAAAGRDGAELLERAPGVWMDGEKISINGKGGTKVFVNDRELRMEPAQLMAYLRSLRAEEIQRIEIVPTAGADHDADAAGGIVLITLRKLREDGIAGSLAANTTQGAVAHLYSPGANVSLHSGRFDLNAALWGTFGHDNYDTGEHTRYTAGDKELHGVSAGREHYRDGGGMAGVVFAIDGRNSIGAEINYLLLDDKTGIDTRTELRNGSAVRTDSRYDNRSRKQHLDVRLNYMRKIDTLGSTFKILADYTVRDNDIRDDNRSRITDSGLWTDSLFRDDTKSRYDVTALTVALDRKLSKRWAVQAGVKYMYNGMRNDALYEYLRNDAWMRNDTQSYTYDYTEHIGAAYSVVTGGIGRMNFVAGLRGEYTRTRGDGIGQKYFSLFPNANLSCRLSEDGAHSLIVQYARTIERPQFWTLTPQRTQLTDYTCQIGNPELRPSYKQDVSLTLVLAHKYTLTGGAIFRRDEIQQTIRADADDPDRISVTWINFDATTSWYAAADLPFRLTRWWQLNLGANYIRQEQQIERHGKTRRQNMLFTNLSTSFHLPLDFIVDVTYRYQSRVETGQIWIDPNHRLDASVKKRFSERFTLSLSAQNLLDAAQTAGGTGDGFVRTMRIRQNYWSRTFRIGITYNFRIGKAFERKAVESAVGEDAKRL